jgi:uncharacterized protein YdbL (DUF1318 family)
VVLTCASDLTVAECQTQGDIDLAFTNWLATVTNTGGCNAVISDDNTGAPLVCGGSTTVSWTVTSDCETPVTCSATFTVTDAPAVVLTCPADLTVAECQTQGDINLAFTNWLATVTNTGGCNAVISDDNTGAPLACGGSTTVSWTVTSDCESPITCSATFTVTDAPAVVLTCPADLTVAECQTQGDIDLAFTNWLVTVTNTDGCNAAISDDNTGAPLACGGSTTVTWTVTSDCESPVTCSATFTVTDAPAVVLTCANDLTVAECQTQGDIDLAFTNWLATVTNTGGCNAVISDDNTGAPLACGGSTTVTWTVTSDCESPVTCSATFTVTDAPAVVLTCPSDQTELSCQTQGDIDNAYASWLATVTFGGGCNATITNDDPGAPDICGGTSTVTWTVSSSCEGDVTCTATFAIDPVSTLSISCPSDTSLTECQDQATVDALFASWLAQFSFNGGCIVSENGNTGTAPNYCGGSVTIDYSVSDECGQSDNCTASFTVNSAPLLSINCPGDTTLTNCQDQTTVDVLFVNWLNQFTFSGGCSVTENGNSGTAPDACGGSITINYSVLDECGQTANCTATFTIDSAPVLSINCPSDTILSECLDQVMVDALFNSWLSQFTYSGGCSITEIGNTGAAPDACGGSTTINYSVTDVCGQSQNCQGTFTVNNAPDLSVICPGSITLSPCRTQTDVDNRFANWIADFQTIGGCNPTSTDLSQFDPPSACGGSVTVDYLATDNCGQSVSCFASFSVDNPPALTIACPTDIIISECQTQTQIDSLFYDWLPYFTTTGGCAPVSTDLDIYSPPDACGGSVTINYSTIDACGQTDTCVASFTVVSVPVLIITCPSNQNELSCQSQSEIDSLFNIWISEFNYSGGCGSTATIIDTFNAPPSCGGEVTINYSVTDDCGQLVSCMSTFTVESPPPLFVTCPSDQFELACQSQSEIDTKFSNWIAQFEFTGGCNTIETDLSGESPPSSSGGSVTINYSAMGDCGQMDTCSATFTVELEPSCTVTVDQNVNCFNGNEGQATVTPQGGTQPYLYVWNDPNNQTTETATGLIAGIYEVTVTDANGCTTSCSVEITQPPELILQCVDGFVLCFGDNDGSVSVNVNGGIPGYSYIWSDPLNQTMQTATGLSAGFYTVTVTDINGCSDICTAEVSEPLEELTLSLIPTNVDCSGESTGSIDLTVTGGTQAYTYDWDNDGTGDYDDPEDLNNLSAGSYSITVLDANGCSESASVTIVQPDFALELLTTHTDVDCNGNNIGSIDLTVTGGTSPYTYDWDNDGTGDNDDTQDLSNLFAGTYTVVVYDAFGCSDTTSVTIIQPDFELELSTAQINVDCNGNNIGSIDLTVTGGTQPYTYDWDNDGTGDNDDAQDLFIKLICGHLFCNGY